MMNDGPIEKAWALPNLTEVATMEPFSAFMVFAEYADRALSVKYMDALKSELQSVAASESIAAMELVKTKSKKPPKTIQTADLIEIKLEYGPYIDQLEAMHAPRIEQDILQRLRHRIAPLLPAIRNYVEQRERDTITATRLGWLIDGIRNGHGYAVKPKTTRARTGIVDTVNAYMDLWRDLYTGLLDIAGQYDPPMDKTSANASAMPERQTERIVWKGSTIEFITIVKKLMERNYLDISSTGGKHGEGNVTECIRRLQQTFIVRKDDLSEFTAEGLSDRWRGRPMGGDRELQFDIPEATRKRPRK